ncbi:MAG: transporter ATP-binding protein [Patescibacteria group bacterium]|nr:transporter ATP-binding protein [Patescibacteria group bacterium]
MARDIAIAVSGVSKTFKLPHERYSSLKQNALHIFTKRRYSQFKAVEDINFEVRRGEFFGIVGRNGCGKSTLLKMLAGIYVPTKGSVRINGSLSPFIELGVGFNPELTARDNVFLNGAILGLNRKEIAAKFDDIIGFAELEEFVDQKLKNFSSGMQVRLAFSIAIQAQSEILLVDEVLAVGDSSFQKKCFDVFRRLKKKGTTIVFVTHDMANVQEFCDRVLVMSEGKKLALTGPDQASDLYNRLNAQNDLDEMEQLNERNRWGTERVKVRTVEFLDGTGKPNRILTTGEPMTLRVELEPTKLDVPLLVGLALYQADGTHVAGPNSDGVKIQSGERFIEFTVDKLPLTEGTYTATVALFDKKGAETFDYIDKGFSFAVGGLKRTFGNMALFGEWRTKK